MRDVIAQIEALPMPRDEFVGSGVMCLTDIISRPYPAHSVVPSGCRCTYERRLLPGEEQEAVLGEITAACERAGAADTRVQLARTDVTTYTGVRWDQPKWFAPWQLPEEHDLVQKALAGLRGVGQSPALTAYQFCTNAAYSAGDAGIPTIGYGPGREDLAHIVDEYVELEHLTAATAGYRAILESLLG